ncbi:MAG: DUF1570 domain-containing protein, partial [Planctomycetota bacterium]
SRHFEVHCNATEQLSRRYSRLMEIIRQKLSGMFHSPTSRNLSRSAVFIYCNQEEFMNNDRYGQWGGRGLGGYYMPSNGSITTYHGTFGFTGTTFKVLAHEAVHYYQGLVLKGSGASFDQLPIWLVEGMAVYFGDGSKFDAERQKITVGLIPRDRLAHIQEKMLAQRHTPVKKLVKMTRYQGFNGSHYADAWALIYFLVKSSKDGEKLMKNYWARGLDRRLAPRDFEELADKYYGGLDKLEEQYISYILRLNPPSAGVIKGDYFISDDFQFEFRAPGPDWEFFEDGEDKKLLVGLLSPDQKAQVRVYYENNIYNKEADDYMDEYISQVVEKDGSFEKLRQKKVKISGLPGYRLMYRDTGKRPASFDVEIKNGRPVFREKKAKKQEPRDIVKFMLVQVDGIASIECSVPKGKLKEYRDVFEKMNENFSIALTRRW